MTEEAIRNYVARHNTCERWKSIGFVLLALPLWLISFALLFLMAAFPLFMLQLTESPRWPLIFAIAMCILLIHRAWREGSAVFSEYRRPGLEEVSGGACVINHYSNRVTAVAYLLTQFLYCAPVCTVAAIRHHAAQRKFDDAEFASIEVIVRGLLDYTPWQEIERFDAFGGLIYKLHSVGLVLFREGPRGHQIRLSRMLRPTD